MTDERIDQIMATLIQCLIVTLREELNIQMIIFFIDYLIASPNDDLKATLMCNLMDQMIVPLMAILTKGLNVQMIKNMIDY